jgi:hypothetical protein
MSPSAVGSGAPRPLSVFFGVTSVCSRNAEGPGGCGLGILIAEEVDGVGFKGSGYTTMVIVETLLGGFV